MSSGFWFDERMCASRTTREQVRTPLPRRIWPRGIPGTDRSLRQGPLEDTLPVAAEGSGRAEASLRYCCGHERVHRLRPEPGLRGEEGRSDCRACQAPARGAIRPDASDRSDGLRRHEGASHRGLEVSRSADPPPRHARALPRRSQGDGPPALLLHPPTISAARPRRSTTTSGRKGCPSTRSPRLSARPKR
jgi:hypothetical protein